MIQIWCFKDEWMKFYVLHVSAALASFGIYKANEFPSSITIQKCKSLRFSPSSLSLSQSLHHGVGILQYKVKCLLSQTVQKSAVTTIVKMEVLLLNVLYQPVVLLTVLLWRKLLLMQKRKDHQSSFTLVSWDDYVFNQ